MDLDGGGQIDILSGSWPGELFLFRGKPGRTFGSPEMIKDRQGEIINIGGGVRKQSGGGLLITGNAKFETTPEGTFVEYKGKASGDGSVSLFRNVGSAKAPKLEAAEQLVPPGETAFGGNAPKEPRRGIRSKVCAADWNGDGRLDLLVGDFATQAPDLPEPTPEHKVKNASLREELEELQRLYSETVQKVFGPNRAKTKEELDKANKDLQEASQKMQELQSQLPAEYENHGWIWLFLRKPADQAAAQ